jgi:hypothetical protein
MEPDGKPDAMESDTGSKVLCQIACLSTSFLTFARSLSFEKGALGSDMPI